MSLFKESSKLIEMMELCIKSVLTKTQSSSEFVETLANKIYELSSCEDSMKEVVAFIHVNAAIKTMTPYFSAIAHALMSSVIAEKLEPGQEDKINLIKAAILANVAYLPHLIDFNMSKRSLSDDQRLILRQHPEQSRDLCLKAGISDKNVLDIIIQHHERKDGTGYPCGITDVSNSALILYTAERYIAMISERNYRESYSIDTARMLIESDIKTPAVYAAFCVAVPRFSPGLIVVLKNQDIAVIKNSKPLEVWGLVDKNLNMFQTPRQMNPTDEFSQIAEIYKGDKSSLSLLAYSVWS